MRDQSRAACLRVGTLDGTSSAGIFAGRCTLSDFVADVWLPVRQLLRGATPIDAFSEQP